MFDTQRSVKVLFDENFLVKEELINEFAVSNMDIETFSEMHNIQPDALKSWIDEVMHPTPSKGEIFSTTDFVELDIPKVAKQGITLSKNRKDLITVRAGGIEIDVPIETCETNLFKILQTAASI